MKQMTRAEAIDALRSKILSLTDDDHCACRVASELHLFCGGFSRWKSDELRKRYDWIVRKWPHLTRRELEDLANRWQLARQFVQGTELSCDTQAIEHKQCKGWDEFSDAELAAHVHKLCGEEAEIVG